MAINRFFGDIWVITLRDEKERQRRVTEQFWKVGITDWSWQLGYRPTDCGPWGFKTPGMWGCVESHLAVIRQAKQYNLSSVLIAEDDVLLWPDFLEKWEVVEPVLRNCPWDLFYFYAKESADIELSMPIPLRVSGEVGGHLYAVHSRFYHRYIEAVEAGMKEGKMQDETLYALPDKIVYAVHPPMAGQAAGYSSVMGCDRPERFMPVERAD